MGKSRLKLVTPTAKKRTVRPNRPPNGDLRSREYLTEAEVEGLMESTKGNRYGHRDATMILVAVGDELRALRRLQREQEPKSPFVFISERDSPFTTAGFARMLERAGVEAKLGYKAHPHMLRHTCGYALANRGHDTRALQAYLGHRNCHRIDSKTFGGNECLHFREWQATP
jgi:site-specific recombinase XerC